MPMEVLAEWSDKDPIKRAEAELLEERQVSEARLESIRERVRDEVRAAVEQSEEDGYPEAAEAHLGVFAESGD
jgi:TPP-dependent pyruvate/acetoin dehydrogenase alpha subunit